MKTVYNIFGWSTWKDIQIFTFGSTAYLLQGRKHKNGKTKFRVRKQGWSFAVISHISIDELKAATLWKQE